MEFLRVAENLLHSLFSDLRQVVTIEPLCSLVVSYVTNLELEFERELLQTNWNAGNYDVREDIWKKLKSAEHPVLVSYCLRLEAHIGTFPRTISRMPLLASIWGKASPGVCNRFRCYYSPLRNCTCNSPLYY